MTCEQRQRTEDKSVHYADILKSAVSEVGVKQVAAQLKVSTSLAYKWCDPKQISGESSVNNPLDSRELSFLSKYSSVQLKPEAYVYSGNGHS